MHPIRKLEAVDPRRDLRIVLEFTRESIQAIHRLDQVALAIGLRNGFFSLPTPIMIGMVLIFGERGSARVDKPMQPLAFSGEWAPGCALIAGPTEDFNVMTDRSRLRHRLERLDRKLSQREASLPIAE